MAGLRRVAGGRTGVVDWAAGMGSGCCPPDDESEEVLWVGWDLHEVCGRSADAVGRGEVSSTGEEGAVVMPASSAD